ncbi:hypothetical protein AVEN_229066-1 [Araneus ventricosus]|uniref:Uncharacterized protein n=1 Tax=Araneus ventricosus TaxID=182803 RepID=A0A4Y2CX70_ARAVE|nr:hypothetical protein AVEN_229066-1 [Araneus ventricosus]
MYFQILVTYFKSKEFGYSEPKFSLFKLKWLEKHRVNAFSQSEIEHFECCDDDWFTSDAPSNEDIVSLIEENNDLTDDSSSDMENEVDASSGSSISNAKAAVNILKNFFATEIVDKNVRCSFLIFNKKIHLI